MVYIVDHRRRRLLQYSALTVAGVTFPGILNAAKGQIKSHPSANFHPDIEIEMTARKAHVPIMKQGPNTIVQKYYAKLLKGPKKALVPLQGNYLGPILNFEKGQKVRIYFYNQLREASIIHWHGLHVPEKSDGHPMYSIASGERYIYEFEVLNRAGTSFYHSHAHELTAEQVYKGLAGLITVSDAAEQALGLPDGEYDVPLVIQDRSYDDRNQLRYVQGMHDRMLGFLGDKILVNGVPDRTFSVKSRAYRFRAVNGSNSRIYKLGWDDGTPLTAIGSDAGLLEKPETRSYIMLAPGERIDLWLDFSGRRVGEKLTLRSLPYSGAMPPMYERMMQRNSAGGMKMGRGMQGGGMGMMGRRRGGNKESDGMQGGMMGGMGMMSGSLAQGADFPIATFHVKQQVNDSPKIPEKLVPIRRLTEKDVDNARQPIPIVIKMKPMAPMLNGKPFALEETLEFERVAINSIKKIKIFHDHGNQQNMNMNSKSKGMQTGMKGGGMNMGMMMSMAHPIHLHGQQYQIISRKMQGMQTDDYATVKDGFIDTGW